MPLTNARIASSVQAVPQSRIRELADIAMSMEGVLRLYFGESDLPTPQYIKDAAIRALQDGYTFYTENAGLPSLRQAIARKYDDLHRVTLDPARNVVVTASGVQALNVSIRCVLDPGDEAIVLTPAWPNGSAIVGMCSARAVQVPHILREGRYEIDFAALESAIGNHLRDIAIHFLQHGAEPQQQRRETIGFVVYGNDHSKQHASASTPRDRGTGDSSNRGTKATIPVKPLICCYSGSTRVQMDD